ncbi:hypothetical protein [Streptomonospora sediminis]
MSRTRWAVATAAVALAASGCTSAPGASPDESPSASRSAPAPGWADVGGKPVASPSAETGAANAEGAPSPDTEPAPLPASCGATGIEDHMSGVLAQLDDPEFTEVRTEKRLECSWAGFDAEEGSEVVMVTFAPEKSLVSYPGHIPVQAQRDPSFFTTEAVAEMGGVAKWDTGEMFSGVNLHLPGLLVSTTGNTPRVETGDLLEAATAAAQELTEGGTGGSTGSPAPADAADPSPTLQADKG